MKRPSGAGKPSDFVVVEAALAPLDDGQILVENLAMSIDPYMRRCMDAHCVDQTPWPLHGPLNGPAIGRVIQSRNATFAIGDIVESLAGWQEHFISDGEPLVPFASSFTSVLKRSAPVQSPRDYLGILGIASFTAYIAIMRANDCRPGDTVVISSAAGSVGSIAAQLAKLRGLRVVASAGSDDKVAWLRNTIGVDHAFNYRSGLMEDLLRDACPNGIDLVLENASPEHLAACLPLMNLGRTILISGFVGLYSKGGKAPPIRNIECVLDRFLTVKAFAYMDYYTEYDRFAEQMLFWRHSGQLGMREVVLERLESAPKALVSLLVGEMHGKPLINICG